MTYRAIVVACTLAGLLGALALGAPVEAATRVAPAKKPTPAEDFKICRTDPGSARLAACDRAIASGKLAKKDLSLAYELRGGAWFGADDLTKAASDLEQATRLDPTNQSAFVTEARILLAKNDPSGALAATTAALKLYETSYAQAVRGEALRALGRDEEAAAAYKEALDHNPGMDERTIAEAGLAALASDPEADARQCHDLSGQAAIDACTRAIDSGKLSGRTLASSYFYRAYEYLKLADYDRVITDCAAAISTDAGYGPPHSAKALALLGKNDAAGALVEANEGVRLFPDSAYAISVRGEAYRELGRRDEAAVDYNKVMTLNPEGPSRQIAQAGLQGLADTAELGLADSCGRLPGDEAIKACDNAIATGKLDGPVLAGVYHGRGTQYAKKPDPESALRDFSEAIRLDPMVKSYYSTRGALYQQLGRRDEAIADYNKVLSFTSIIADDMQKAAEDGLRALGVDPQAAFNDLQSCRGGSANENLAACNRAIGSGRFAGNDLLNLLFSRASDYYQRRDFPHAIADYDASIKIQPTNSIAFGYRCASYYSSHDYDRALTDCNEAIRLNATDAYSHWARGAVLAKLGQRDQALADFSASLSFNPSDAIRQAALAGMQALGLDPAAADADSGKCHDLSGAYFADRDADHALADYSDQIRLQPSNAQAYVGRGHLYSLTGGTDNALADLSKAIALDPGNADALGYRGEAYLYGRHDYDRAIADFTASIRIDPAAMANYADRADAYYAKADYDNAIKDYDASIARAPKEGELYALKTRALLAKHDAANALAAANQAVQLSGNNDEAFAIRGDVYRALGRTAQAKADYDKALSIYKDNKTAAAGLEALSGGK